MRPFAIAGLLMILVSGVQAFAGFWDEVLDFQGQLAAGPAKRNFIESLTFDANDALIFFNAPYNDPAADSQIFDIFRLEASTASPSPLARSLFPGPIALDRV